MRNVEWIGEGEGRLGQQEIRLSPDTVYIATLVIPPRNGECREGPIKDAISAQGGLDRQKLSSGGRNLPNWLQNRPLEAGAFSQKLALIQQVYPGWCVWYVRIKTGKSWPPSFRADSRGGLILGDARIFAIYQDSNNAKVYEVQQTGSGVIPLVSEKSPGPGYIDVNQSGIPSGVSPIPGAKTPPPGTQPPPEGTAPTPVPSQGGMQLYILDPATGSGRAAGDPQPMTHTEVRHNIEATARQPGAPMMGYGEAGTGVPNYGIYSPPNWDKPLVQAWYFDDAAKTWTPWPVPPAPIAPATLRQAVEQAVNAGFVIGAGWSAPGATQPLWVYREGQWQVPAIVQLWAQQGGQWVKVGVPVIRAATGARRDVEAAVAAGSPPLGVSGDGATEPTFTYDGEWKQLSSPVEEAGPTPTYASIPGVQEGTASLPPGISPIIPGVPFPTPAMPGVQVNLVASAIDSIQRAAAACPDIAAPGGPLQHALSAFGVFAAVSAARGVFQEPNLDVLHAELDQLCPGWRGVEPGGPALPTLPSGPPRRPEVSDLLGKVALALVSAATAALPDLYAKAKELGLPGLAEQIRQYAEQSGDPIPGAEAPPPEEPPPSGAPPKKTKKKGISGLAVAGLAVLGIGAAFLLA